MSSFCKRRTIEQIAQCLQAVIFSQVSQFEFFYCVTDSSDRYQYMYLQATVFSEASQFEFLYCVRQIAETGLIQKLYECDIFVTTV